MGSWPLMMLCAPGVSLQFPSVFVVRPVRHPGTYSLIACRFIRSRIIFCAYLVCSTLFLSSDRPVHIFDHFQVNFNSQRTNILDSNDGDEDRRLDLSRMVEDTLSDTNKDSGEDGQF